MRKCCKLKPKLKPAISLDISDSLSTLDHVRMRTSHQMWLQHIFFWVLQKNTAAHSADVMFYRTLKLLPNLRSTMAPSLNWSNQNHSASTPSLVLAAQDSESIGGNAGSGGEESGGRNPPLQKRDNSMREPCTLRSKLKPTIAWDISDSHPTLDHSRMRPSRCIQNIDKLTEC